MGLYINSNIASLQTQDNLNNTTNALNSALEQLSSGQRINSAADDAAGLAISTKMGVQISALNVAAQNANSGITIAQTADGAMGQVSDVLSRMRDLAVQASSDSYSDSDRVSMQTELSQLYSEVDQISSDTTFNGRPLLDGSLGSLQLQVGADANQTVNMSINAVSTKALALNGFSALGTVNSGRVAATSVAANTFAINGIQIGAVAGTTAKLKAAAINLLTSQTGVTATAYNDVSGGSASGNVSGALTINGLTIAASANMSQLVDNINRDASGITAALDQSGNLELSNNTGSDIIIGGTVTNSGLTAGTYKGYLSLASQNGGQIKVTLGSSASATVANSVNSYGFNNIATANDSQVAGSNVTSVKVTTGDEITINGVILGASASDTASDKAGAINAISTQTDVTATATTTLTGSVPGGVFTVSLTSGASGFVINGVNIVAGLGATIVHSMSEFVNYINTGTTAGTGTTQKVSGVSASINTLGELVLTSSTGANITVSGADDATGANPATTLSLLGMTTHTGTTRGVLTLTNTLGGAIDIDSNLAQASKTAAIAKLGLVQQGGNTNVVSSGLSISTQSSAESAITSIDSAINTISTYRANLGAIENRLTSTVSVINDEVLNTTNAQQAVSQTNYATETAVMSQNQILEQVATSILTQANALPQAILKLLQ